MTDIYVNTTLSRICKSAIEMDNREHAEENVYETLEVVGASRYRNNVSQRKAEPEDIMEEKSSSSHRIRPAKSESLRKVSLIQCIVVILVSLTFSSITGVVVYKLTKDGMKEIQLEIKSELSSISSLALSNLSESFQDQIALLEKEMRQNVTILEHQMKDNATVLEQHMKDNATVLEQHMKDNLTVLEQQMKYNDTVLEQQMKDNVTALGQQTTDNFTVLEQQMKDYLNVLEQHIKDNGTVLEQQMHDNATVLEQHMKDNLTVLEQHMKDNDIVLEQKMKDNLIVLEQQMKDNVTALEQQIKDNPTVLEQQMKDNLTALEQQMKDNVTVLEQQMKDNLTVLEQQIKDNPTVLEQQMKNNLTALEQQMKDNVTVLEQQMKDNLTVLEQQTEIDINNLKGNLSTNVTNLYKKLYGVESEQSQLANRFHDRSTSISAFTATYPAYSGKSYSSNYYTLNFSRTIYNLGGDFNSSTGMFTCTKPGTYYFSVFLVKKRSTVRVDFVSCYVYKNTFNIIRTEVDPTDDDTDKGGAEAANSAVIHLNTGDVVYLGSCNSVSSMESWSSFSGFLLYPDA